MLIVKLGGSVITNKKIPYKFDELATKRLAKEIFDSKKKCVIVHGAGSFGHPLAKKYGLNEGSNGKKKLEGFSLTHSSVRNLNMKVIDVMRSAGIKAVSIPPFPITECSNGKIEKFDCEIFKKALEIGLTPVTFGDVVIDNKKGFCICSGDLLVKELAKKMIPDQAIFATDVDGIYSDLANKILIEEATAEDLDEIEIGESGTTDVTHGMKGKVEVIKDIAKMGIQIAVINGKKNKRLYNAMMNKVSGTRIRGEK
jgi:isopentenyl phosphate kinase